MLPMMSVPNQNSNTHWLFLIFSSQQNNLAHFSWLDEHSKWISVTLNRFYSFGVHQKFNIRVLTHPIDDAKGLYIQANSNLCTKKTKMTKLYRNIRINVISIFCPEEIKQCYNVLTKMFKNICFSFSIFGFRTMGYNNILALSKWQHYFLLMEEYNE